MDYWMGMHLKAEYLLPTAQDSLNMRVNTAVCRPRRACNLPCVMPSTAVAGTDRLIMLEDTPSLLVVAVSSVGPLQNLP
jgi:hypothetical protein